MLPNYIKDLLDLEDVIVTKTIHADKYVKFFLDTKPNPHICPVCGKTTAKIHDYRWQTIRDLPFQLKTVILLFISGVMSALAERNFMNPMSSFPDIYSGQNDLHGK